MCKLRRGQGCYAGFDFFKSTVFIGAQEKDSCLPVPLDKYAKRQLKYLIIMYTHLTLLVSN